MPYRATLQIDYSLPHDNNQRNRLWNALVQCGWTYAETSAFVYDGADLLALRRALEVLARQVDLGGTLSALNLNVQLVAPNLVVPGAQQHLNARHNVFTNNRLPSAN